MPADRAQSPVVPEGCLSAILHHLAHYRLTVFAALERLPVFATSGPQAVKAVLRAGQQQALLASAPLHHGARYWFLEAGGAQSCGLPAERSGPLSEPAKLRALALLRFCCLSDRPRHRLTAAELTKSFPGLYRPGLPDGYYFDPQGTGRLGLARVDGGHRGRWDRVLQALRQDIADHLLQAGFRRLIQAGRFEITLLTIFRQKTRRLADSWSQDSNAGRVPVQMVALPELLPLLSSRP